ncbi:MAG: prephenate dehydrogenase/arogenate dehydrogenase family protein, partial [Henriciella sp.]|uniref:prephenate dehydrogenase/arogenate dehydrogenase family protein n=1 Tax=Henriciella sp. TaxID=1968823 RepID=UPI003C76D510
MTAPVFDEIAIIGIGLIGSSLARAAAENGAASKISLFDQDDAVRATAGKLGLGTIHDSLEKAVAEADCVVIAVPVGAIEATTKALAPHLKPAAILSDVGSVKESAMAAMQAHCPAHVHL